MCGAGIHSLGREFSVSLASEAACTAALRLQDQALASDELGMYAVSAALRGEVVSYLQSPFSH